MFKPHPPSVLDLIFFSAFLLASLSHFRRSKVQKIVDMGFTQEQAKPLVQDPTR